MLIVGVAAIAIAVSFGMLRVQPDSNGMVFGRLDAARLPLLKRLSVGALILFCVLA